MRGLAKTAPRRGSVERVEVETPEIAPDEVLVEVAFAGLCGSDLGIYQFENAYDFMDFPRVLGHEYSGRIVEAGTEVTRFAVGDRVVETPNHGCGDCYHCKRGDQNRCREFTVTGVHHHGAFAPHVAVPGRFLYPIPDDLSLRHAAAAEPTAVATRAVGINSRARAGDRVLVEGPGPIGLLTAQIARTQGATVIVTGVDRDENVRLPTAATLGFETNNVDERGVDSLREDRTDDLGFDVVFDATGHESGLRGAARAVRKGGQVVVVGQSGNVSLDFTPFIRGEVDVQCSYAATWEDFQRAMRLLGGDDVGIEPLLDDSFELSDEGAVFEAAMNGETVKPVFEVGGELE